MSLRVAPSGRYWTVERFGVTMSTHHQKDEAVEFAEVKAAPGEDITIHRGDGTIQEVR